MRRTQADLAVAERQVSTLEHFIAEQRTVLALAEWSDDEKEQGRRVLGQFEEALRQARSQYRAIWLELYEQPDCASEAASPAQHASREQRRSRAER